MKSSKDCLSPRQTAKLLGELLHQESVRRTNTALRKATGSLDKIERRDEIALHDARILTIESAIHHLKRIKK